MNNLVRKELKKLVDFITLSDLDVLAFMGYTTRQEIDLEGKSRDFLKDEMKYFKLMDIHGGNLYISQEKLVDVALGEAELEIEEGDIYTHGYPEGRLVPGDHGEVSEEVFMEGYLKEFTELFEAGLENII